MTYYSPNEYIVNDNVPVYKFDLIPSIFFSLLRERLRTHNVFTKDKCFYLNYDKFSIKSCF